MTDELKERIAKIHNGEVPEGYLKTACGIIPEEWKSVSLSNISDEITEKVGDREYETLSISAGIGFVNQANKFGKELSGKQYEKYTVLRKNDFSYNKGNSKKYPQGCIYKLNDRDEAAVPNVFESFRLKVGVPEYYEQVFFFGFLNRQLAAKINHGVRDDGLLNLTGNDFYSCEVPVPPLPEQQKIAEILSTQDKVIELIRKQIEELQKLKKAYLQKMFPKKGCAYPEIRFKGFTDAWEQRKLFEEFSKFIVPMRDKPKEFGGTIPWTRIEDIEGKYLNGSLSEQYVTEETIRKMNLKIIPKDSLIVSSSATFGVVAVVTQDLITNQTFIGLVPNDKETLDYWYVFFHSDEARNYMRLQSAGSTIFYISRESFENMPIKVPSKDEMCKIGTYFDNLDNLITLHQRKLEQEQQKKKALMQLLLTGIVRVKV